MVGGSKTDVTDASSILVLGELPPVGGPTVKGPVAGAYVGDGMPLVPARLAAKIRRWEFVEMWGIIAGVLGRTQGGGSGSTKGKADEASS